MRGPLHVNFRAEQWKSSVLITRIGEGKANIKKGCLKMNGECSFLEPIQFGLVAYDCQPLAIVGIYIPEIVVTKVLAASYESFVSHPLSP
jgi:hypothetical protein